MSRKERREAGRERRERLPLAAHAAVPDPAEPRDAIGILTAQDAHRLAELVPIRHGRMSATSFTFYRGGAAIMAADLANTPTTDIDVQLCGDAHLANFGLYNGPDRRLVFDLNDFDETHTGPFEWDVKRLAASVSIAGRNNGLPDKKIERAVRASAAGYRSTISELSGVGPLAVHHRRLEVDHVRDMIANTKQRSRVERAAAKAAGKNHLRAFAKLTAVVDGRRIIVPDPPLVTRIDERAASEQIPLVLEFYRRYLDSVPPYRRRLLERYTVVDLARKVVGVGSVGTRCLIVLLESGDGEPLFLQLKEATASVLEPHLGTSDFEPGERVVVGQRLLQTMGDILLGWSYYETDTGDPLHFYVRQLWDGKGSVDVTRMSGKALRRYARFCGAALGLAHARAGDASLIAGYLGTTDTFDRAITEFATSYADLNDLDHAAHVDAIAYGRIPAERDV
ncbi:MAG: DUF2252 domain-containing protein [Acidimicrobiia bacterium]|nr:DUF2252 domain-containing protein [Acidimicrobiia bacterium]